MSSTSPSYADRVLCAAMKRRCFDRIALAALRRATELLGLAIGTRLAQMREEGSPVQALMSRRGCPDFCVSEDGGRWVPPEGGTRWRYGTRF